MEKFPESWPPSLLVRKVLQTRYSSRIPTNSTLTHKNAGKVWGSALGFDPTQHASALVIGLTAILKPYNFNKVCSGFSLTQSTSVPNWSLGAKD